MYTPKNLKKWRYTEGYIGTEYTDFYCFLSKTDADRDVLNASNYAVALERLGGKSESVLSACFKHFACGYFELILIHESDDKALQEADKIADEIRRYPVLDEDDFSERELASYDEAIDTWAFNDACNMIGIDGNDLKPENKSRIARACLDCFYYHGEAYLDEKEIWKSLKESKEIVPFSWVEYEKSKGQGFLAL